MKAFKTETGSISFEIFPFSELKIVTFNSLQATVILAFPSCPSQNRMSEASPKRMSQLWISFCISAVARLKLSLRKAPSCPES